MAYHKCASIYGTANSAASVQTASGAIANFSTQFAMPLIKSRFNFKATQDLHGQSGPYPAGGSAQIWDEVWELGIIGWNGDNASSTTKIRCKNYISVKPNTAYYFVSPKNIQLFYYDANQNFISYEGATFRNASKTMGANVHYIRFYIYDDTYGTTYNNDISINYPSTDTAYHPYSNICPISGVSEVNLYQCADNVIVNDTLVNAYIANDGSTVSNTGYKCTDFIELDANATNVVERFKTTQGNGRLYRVAFYDSNKTFIDFGYSETITYADFTAVVPIPSGAKYFRACVNVNKELWFIGINGSTTLINLGGTYYGGYVEQDKDGHRQLVVDRKFVTLDSSMSYARGDNNKIFYSPSDVIKPATSTTNMVKSSHYVSTLPATFTNNAVYKPVGNTTITFVDDVNGVDLPTWKAFLDAQSLANTPVQLVYLLAESIIIPLTDGEPIKTLPGINNIFCDTGDTSLQFIKLGN